MDLYLPCVYDDQLHLCMMDRIRKAGFSWKSKNLKAQMGKVQKRSGIKLYLYKDGYFYTRIPLKAEMYYYYSILVVLTNLEN